VVDLRRHRTSSILHPAEPEQVVPASGAEKAEYPPAFLLTLDGTLPLGKPGHDQGDVVHR